MLSLREGDRAALLLRFYETQSLREVGVALGVGEDAAQKRVAVALERLARFFQRRGFKTATVAATTAALQHTATSTPAAVTTAVEQSAMQVAPPTTVGMTALLTRFASLTKVQKALLCGLAIAVPLAWRWAESRQAGTPIARSRVEHKVAEIQKKRPQTRARAPTPGEAAARQLEKFAMQSVEALRQEQQ